MDPLISWLIIVLLVLTAFFFSGAETALACANHYKIQVEADEGKRYAKTLMKILDNYDRTLTTVLIGNNIVNIAMSAVATTLFIYYFQATTIGEYVASLIASIVITFIVFVFGDTLPKTICRSIPDTMSKFYCYPIYILNILFFPITFLFDLGMKGVEKLFKLKKEDELTEEEFSEVVEKASEEDMIDEDQAEIVQSTLDFIDTNVKQVLTPRSKIFAVNLRDLSYEKVQEILTSTSFTRIPVYDKVFDNMVGVLITKIYLEEYAKDKHVNIRSILQKPYYVPNTIMIDDLFRGFKKHHTHIALVRDTHNKIVGMVTMEDVLEEIVSDISEPKNRRKE